MVAARPIPIGAGGSGDCINNLNNLAAKAAVSFAKNVAYDEWWTWMHPRSHSYHNFLYITVDLVAVLPYAVYYGSYRTLSTVAGGWYDAPLDADLGIFVPELFVARESA